ncbi:MAG: membrane integrity-associated transporter subunit PqiC [Magnetococcales bacterium]|nr:membrane integrity-associated transporter subunit PqiC [Magnetococcales bacterium]
MALHSVWKHDRSPGVRRTLCLCLSFMLVACTSTGSRDNSALLRHFLLTPTATDQPSIRPALPADFSLEILQVSIPTYLNRSQIVTRPGPNELFLSEIHQWGDTLADNMTRTLATNLAHLLGHDRVFPQSPRLLLPTTYRLATEVYRFEQDADGRVVLDLLWRLFVSHETVPVVERRAHWSSDPLPGTDYPTLVAAMSRLLGDFSTRAAREIATIRHPRQAD